VSYAALFSGAAAAAPISDATIGEFLRCSMGLSAWKQYQASRWPLRVNPSSGNLHPTECYVAWNFHQPTPGPACFDGWRDVAGFPCDLAVETGAVLNSRGWQDRVHPCRRRPCAVAEGSLRGEKWG